jgi:hypothetical protein
MDARLAFRKLIDSADTGKPVESFSIEATGFKQFGKVLLWQAELPGFIRIPLPIQ